MKIRLNENNENAAYICRNDIAVLDKFNANEVSIFSFKEHGFHYRIFTLILVYRKNFMQMQQLFSDVVIFTSNHLLFRS